MKKVCVSTYCDWNNYGSIMQSLGLKRALLQLGYESVIVQDKPAPSACYISSMGINKNILSSLKNSYRYCKRREIAEKYENSLKFMRKHVDMRYYDTYDVLKKNPPEADIYLAGSDQIWRPQSCHPVFFLDFVKNNQKRISYAASMGNTNIPDEKKDIFTDCINRFDVLSVREQDNADVIQALTGRKPYVHIDPAFLCTTEEWRTYQKPYDIQEKYILLYALYWDVKLNRQVKQLHKETGLPIVAICNGASRVWANRRLFDVDPGQFLWLVDNAEAVITSSFHGVAFSIIFNKKLAAVVNPKLPSRLENLLQMLEVTNTPITAVKEADIGFYEKTNERILEEKQKSMNYLKRALSEDE